MRQSHSARFLSVCLLSAAAVILMSARVYAGANETNSEGRPIRWSTQSPITYLVNPNGVQGFSTDLEKAVVTGAIADAFRAWTSIPATIHFRDGGTTQLSGFASDLSNVISFQDPGNTFSFPPGVLAITNAVFVNNTGLVTLPNGRQVTVQFPGQIIDGDILFNPSIRFSPNRASIADLVAILQHEIGHMLGLDHTGVLSSVMNPFGESGDASASRTLQNDDLVTLANLYPVATFVAATATISGTITTSGGAPVKSANVVAIATPGGVPVASQLAGADGTYRLEGLAPGTYQVMVEPLDGPITLGNFPGFYSNGSSNFATTYLGGSATPTTISLSVGQTATANVVVPDSSPTLPNVDRMAANPLPLGASTTFLFSSAPLYLPRGKSYQLTFIGSNLGSDTNFRFSAPASDINPQGATSGATLTSGQTVRQQNIAISANATLGSSNVSLTGSGGTSVMPGGVVVTPNSTIAEVFNAASSGTSTARRLAPGTLFTLYGADVAAKSDNWLGAVPQPTIPVGAAAPTYLGGISVKLDDQYVPLFFTCPGPQSCGQFQQINGMIPFEVAAGAHRISIVMGPNASSAEFPITLSASAPGLFSTDSSGNGQGAILNGADNSVAATTGMFPGSHPAAPGSVVVIYASGLGPVTPPLPSGVGSGANGSPFPQLARLPQLTVGGQSIPAGNFQFYGLSPTYVGLYQLNVVLPANIPTGNAVPVIVTTAEGQTSNTVTMAIGQ